MQENINLNQPKQRTNERTRPAVAPRRLVGWLAGECTWIAGGWLLGQASLAFESYPLGLAFLCAAGNHTLPILIGLIASALLFVDLPAVYIATYVAAAAIRLLSGLLLEESDPRETIWERLRERLFSRILPKEEPGEIEVFWGGQAITPNRKKGFGERMWLRLAAGALCALCLALYRILVNGFQYYDFFAAVFALVITVAATVIFSFSLNGQSERSVMRRISLTVLLFSFVYASNSVAVLGISLAPILAMLFTLHVTHREGLLMGAVCAVAVGVAYDPLHAPAYLLAALVCGMMKKDDRGSGGAAFSALAALTWLVYIDGVGALLVYLPAFLLAGAVFALAERLFEARVEESEPQMGEESLHRRMEGNRHKDSTERFRGISEAFSSLSEVFYNLSDRFHRPGALDLRRVCDRTFDRYCSDCPHKTVCWGLEYTDTLNVVNRLTSALRTKGKVTGAQIPPSLSHRCEQIPRILESINRDCAHLTGEMLRNNRAEIFAMDYEAAASIINDALEEDDREYRFDPEEAQKILEYLTDAGVRAEGVTVYGKRRKQIIVRRVEVDGARIPLDTVRADLGEMCGLLLDRPMLELNGRIGTMTLRAKRKIAVKGAKNNMAAGKGVSGDTVNLFTNKKDYFYALISDGMGVGREAAETSDLCSVFLEKMLRAGNRAHTSLRVLNNLVCSRSGDSARECSSTVDLLELDLMTGECVFIKSGAAPSFVIRRGTVHRIRCGSAPIGILSDVEVQSTAYCLQPGDVVVMVSDGILLHDPECRWLTSYLGQAREIPPEEIVRRICARAVEFGRHDDCSAVALRIESPKE